MAARTAKSRRPAPRPFKPFKAKDHPHRDYRGEKIVRGVKVRV